MAIALAVFQILSGMKMHGKLGGGFGPKWLGRAHRASGTLAFLFTIPVAYHCLWALGFRADAGARVLIHSLAGCVFFGAIATKVFFVRSRRLPRWALPAGGRRGLHGARGRVDDECALVLHNRRVSGVLTVKPRTFNKVIAVVLIVGAVILVLLLGGVGSGLLTNPPA